MSGANSINRNGSRRVPLMKTAILVMIMSTTLLYAFIIMIANLTVDIVYGALDPRIKVS